jgi:hypothetical protein
VRHLDERFLALLVALPHQATCAAMRVSVFSAK